MPPSREPPPAEGPQAEAAPAELKRIEARLEEELGDAVADLQLAALEMGSTATTRIHRATMSEGAALLVEVRLEGSDDLRAGTADQRLVADLLSGHPLVEIALPVDSLSTAAVRTTQDPGGQTLTEARVASEETRRDWAEALWRLCFGTLRRNGLALSGLDPTLLRFLPHGRVAIVRLGPVEHVEPVAIEWYEALIRAAQGGEEASVQSALDDLGGAAPPSWYQPRRDGDAEISSLVEPAGPDLPPAARPLDRLHLMVGRLLEELDARPPIHDVMAELWWGAPPTTPSGEAEAEWWKSRATLSLLDRLGDRSG